MFAEGNGDVGFVVSQLYEHRHQNLGSVSLGGLDDAHFCNVGNDGLTPLLLEVGEFGIAEVGTRERYIFLHILLVDLGTCHRYLRVGQYDGDLLALTLDVLFGEGAKVDICLELRINGNGHLTIAYRHLDIEATLQQGAFQAHHVIVGYNLMDMIFGGVEPGTFLYLGDE